MQRFPVGMCLRIYVAANGEVTKTNTHNNKKRTVDGVFHSANNTDIQCGDLVSHRQFWRFISFCCCCWLVDWNRTYEIKNEEHMTFVCRFSGGGVLGIARTVSRRTTNNNDDGWIFDSQAWRVRLRGASDKPPSQQNEWQRQSGLTCWRRETNF